MTVNPLEAYYATIDVPDTDIDAALAYFEPDATITMNFPGQDLRGSSHAFLRTFLEGRGSTVWRHNVLRSAHAGGVEFVYGSLVDVEADKVAGFYLAAAQTNEAGRITAYQVVFDAEAPSLLPS